MFFDISGPEFSPWELIKSIHIRSQAFLSSHMLECAITLLYRLLPPLDVDRENKRCLLQARKKLHSQSSKIGLPSQICQSIFYKKLPSLNSSCVVLSVIRHSDSPACSKSYMPSAATRNAAGPRWQKGHAKSRVISEQHR